MKKLYTIGEVARIKEMTIKALRYYHKVGILVPSVIDEETGYRYYTIDQFIAIDVIKGCRALGTSIVELQELFKEKDTDKLLTFLQTKRKEAEENIQKMKEIIQHIDALNESVTYGKALVNEGEIRVRDLDERYIIVSPCKAAGKLQELLYYSDLEKRIQEVETQIGEEIGLRIGMERGILYQLNEQGKAVPWYVFNTCSKVDDLEEQPLMKRLPKGKYLTITYSHENEAEQIQKVVDYIKEERLTVTTFLEVELFNDFFNTQSYSCQLQIYLEPSEA